MVLTPWWDRSSSVDRDTAMTRAPRMPRTQWGSTTYRPAQLMGKGNSMFHTSIAIWW